MLKDKRHNFSNMCDKFIDGQGRKMLGSLFKLLAFDLLNSSKWVTEALLLLCLSCTCYTLCVCIESYNYLSDVNVHMVYK